MNSFSIFHFLIFVIVGLLIYVYYRWALSYKELLLALGEKHKKYEPNLVFLLLVPVLNYFWWVYMSYGIKKAIEIDYQDLGLQPSDDGGFLFAIISVISSFIAIWMPFLGIASVVFWVLSWMKVNTTRDRIKQNFN